MADDLTRMAGTVGWLRVSGRVFAEEELGLCLTDSGPLADGPQLDGPLCSAGCQRKHAGTQQPDDLRRVGGREFVDIRCPAGEQDVIMYLVGTGSRFSTTRRWNPASRHRRSATTLVRKAS
jgi:hypothetical protein